jgi:hypothetical protein
MLLPLDAITRWSDHEWRARFANSSCRGDPTGEAASDFGGIAAIKLHKPLLDHREYGYSV